MSRDYKLDFIVDDMKLFSFDQQDSVADIFKVLDEIEDSDVLKKVEIKIETNETETEDKISESYSYSDSEDLISKLKAAVDVAGVDFSLDGVETLVITFDNGDVWTLSLSDEDDTDELVDFITNKIKDREAKKVSESYKENADGSFTIWSASDLQKDGYQIPLVNLKKDDEGKFYAEQVGDSEFDVESYNIAQRVIDTANRSNKDDNYILVRVDKTLNHNDPFFGVELDRSVVNSPTELIAAQALRTLRDDLKNFVDSGIRNGKLTEEDIVNKFTELTGVNYYTDEVIADNITVKLPEDIEEYKDKDGKTKYRQIYKTHTFSGEEQYNTLLGLLGKDPKDKYNYIPPDENPFIQRLKDLTEDLIEKLLLKQDPSFYNNGSSEED